MRILRDKRAVNLIAPFKGAGNVDFRNVLRADRFRRVIERERSRSDRNSHGFSMVIFDADIRNGGRKRTKELARILESRIRISDVLGWTGESEMAALLPDTHPDGARKFSDYVRCIMMSEHGEAPMSRVYSYPERLDTDAEDEDSGQLWFEGFDKPDSASTAKLTAPCQGEVSGQGSDGAGNRPSGKDESTSWNIEAADGVVDEVMPRSTFTVKRVFDVLGAGCGLILVSPIMALTAALIKVVSPGPVLFRQERVGYMGRSFVCLKFRTMHVDADASGHRNYFSKLITSARPMEKLDAADKDPRLIPFARLIRMLAIDELPQLINVLKGDMSLIGPRPCIPYEYEEFSRWHRQRVHAIPGMTGLWQVSGKNRTTFAEMMRLDIRYSRKRNIFSDVAIVVKTVPAIAAQVMDGLSRRVRG